MLAHSIIKNRPTTTKNAPSKERYQIRTSNGTTGENLSNLKLVDSHYKFITKFS
ncbi:hypothetical protein Sjap_001531 [Stephania japonica]|uniref:Uncharacterized protein n=1 Tax=Stephania japonica TaxID=461633 RepID=A0AAP0KK96_9MAGN